MSKPKQYYTVTIDGMIPISVSYRVLAEDEDEAFKLVSTSPNTNLTGQPKLNFLRLKKSKVSIKNTLTGLMNWIKYY